MDNLTHTLVGALVGEAIVRVAGTGGGSPTSGMRRTLVITSMVVGGNLPDLDLLYSALYSDKLDYLLHHRGHTHTILGALATSVLLWLALAGWVRWKRWSPDETDRLALLATALLAPLLHIAMDFANNYGVHPFWPLDNRWYYGDSVFIIEPLLWAACAPLAFTLQSRIARAAIGLVLVAGAALALFSGMVPTANAIALVALTFALLALSRYTRASVAVAAGLAVWLMTTVTFSLASEVAAKRIDAIAARRFARETLLDRVVTPMPVNPVCWEVIMIQRHEDAISLRRGMLSIAPARVSAQGCLSRSLDVETTAPLTTVDAPDDAQIKWYGQTSFSRSHLARLAAADCRVAAFLQFARAPWLAAAPEGAVIGDLRYDREPELGFAELALEDAMRCPQHLPPWLPPRADLLR